jgi:hypothetical protein
LQEQAIIGIIQDVIVFERITEGMIAVLNAFNPQKYKGEFEPNYTYKGLENAIFSDGFTCYNPFLKRKYHHCRYKGMENRSLRFDGMYLLSLRWIACL